MKEHIYKGNKIIEYSDGTFEATHFADEDRDIIIGRDCRTLEEAHRYLDKNGYSIED